MGIQADSGVAGNVPMDQALAIANSDLRQLEAEQFYHLLLDRVADGVYFVDTDRRICFWNRQAEKFTGFPSDQVLGTCCADNILMHVDAEGRRLCEEACPLSATMADGVGRDAHAYLHHRDATASPSTSARWPCATNPGGSSFTRSGSEKVTSRSLEKT